MCTYIIYIKYRYCSTVYRNVPIYILSMLRSDNSPHPGKLKNRKSLNFKILPTLLGEKIFVLFAFF